VQRMMERFSVTAFDNWEKKPQAPARVRRPRATGSNRKGK